MTNDNQLTREEHAWLVEYQTCQKEKHSQAATYWTIVGIFLSFITAIAGALSYGALSGELSYNTSRWPILGFSFWAIAIILLLALWLCRTNKIINTANCRMREIENTRGMQLSNRIKNRLDKSRFCKYLPGKCIAAILFFLISMPWIFLIIAAICPQIGELMFVQ